MMGVLDDTLVSARASTVMGCGSHREFPWDNLGLTYTKA